MFSRFVVTLIGGYYEYIEGMFSTSGDIMMHVGDIMSSSEDVQYIGVFNVNQRLLSTCSPT